MPNASLVRLLGLPLLACLLLPLAATAQERPAMAVANLSQPRFAADFLRQAQAREAEQARQRAAAAPNATNTRTAQPPTDTTPEFVIAGAELNRFAVDIKGALLQSGLYRIFPSRVYQPSHKETITDIHSQITKGLYPDADYVLFGTVDYINTAMTSNPAGDKQMSHTLALDVVIAFVLVNTRTKTIDAAFSSIGQGSDMHVSKDAGTVIAINKSKILKEVSQSLANGVVTELSRQLTVNKSTENNARPAAANSSKTHTITIK